MTEAVREPENAGLPLPGSGEGRALCLAQVDELTVAPEVRRRCRRLVHDHFRALEPSEASGQLSLAAAREIVMSSLVQAEALTARARRRSVAMEALSSMVAAGEVRDGELADALAACIGDREERLPIPEHDEEVVPWLRALAVSECERLRQPLQLTRRDLVVAYLYVLDLTENMTEQDLERLSKRHGLDIEPMRWAISHAERKVHRTWVWSERTGRPLGDNSEQAIRRYFWKVLSSAVEDVRKRASMLAPDVAGVAMKRPPDDDDAPSSYEARVDDDAVERMLDALGGREELAGILRACAVDLRDASLRLGVRYDSGLREVGGPRWRQQLAMLALLVECALEIARSHDGVFSSWRQDGIADDRPSEAARQMTRLLGGILATGDDGAGRSVSWLEEQAFRARAVVDREFTSEWPLGPPTEVDDAAAYKAWRRFLIGDTNHRNIAHVVNREGLLGCISAMYPDTKRMLTAVREER